MNLSLTQQNADFEKQLKEQEIRHEQLWSEVDGGRTGIEQIITYSLIATAILISGIALCCVLKMQVVFWKRGSGEKRANEAIKLCKDVESRLMDLETNIKLSSINQGTGAKIPQAPPKYGEI